MQHAVGEGVNQGIDEGAIQQGESLRCGGRGRARPERLQRIGGVKELKQWDPLRSLDPQVNTSSRGVGIGFTGTVEGSVQLTADLQE